MCLEAPGLVIEKNRLQAIGGNFLGIIGDANHSFGFHLCSPPSGDYSLNGAANKPVGQYSCAIDIGMNWAASRSWLAWLITEIREDRIKNVAEVIGSFNGRDVRYWSDAETPEWQQNGVPYNGDGHDTWTHVSIYRSTALQDHGLLAGWTATGHTGGTPTPTPSPGGSTMSDFTPLTPPEPVKINGKVRGDSVGIFDVWGQEVLGKSPWDGSKSARSKQLDRIEAAATKAAGITLDAATIKALAAAIVAEFVRQVKP